MTDSKHVKAVVTSRRDVTSELWIYRIRPEEKIVFAPGQYVTVGLQDGPKLVERPYSVCSSPRDPEIEFFLELVPGGHLTPHLYHVPVGGEVTVRRAAKGRFLFDDKSAHRDHFMIATVTGVAPFLSIVRDMVARELEGEPVPYRIALLHAASISPELGFCDELSAYSREHDWFQYLPTISRTWLDPKWGGEIGRCEDLVRKYMHLLGFTSAETTAYACGNPHMIENVKGLLLRAAFPKEFIKQEVYWLAEK